MVRKKILLGHLNSMGDCLFATVIARQIKEKDFPNCHLTWAVNTRSRPAIEANPHVDEIWEISTEKTLTNDAEWNDFTAEVEAKKERGEFDFVFLTQTIGANKFRYDGGIRSSIYNNYPHKISVSHQPTIRLSEAEKENVKQFAARNRLEKYERVILIECGPDSFDSALNLPTALEFASDFAAENAHTALILSSNQQISTPPPNVFDASVLSFRENAELTKYCDLFVGCGSGISWLATTGWAKKLNMILIINEENFVLPSMIYDHDYLNLPTAHLIEIKSNRDSMEKLRRCVAEVFAQDFASARAKYNETISLPNLDYLQSQINSSLVKLNFRRIFGCLRQSVRRNGFKVLFSGRFAKILLEMPRRLANRLFKNSQDEGQRLN